MKKETKGTIYVILVFGIIASLVVGSYLWVDSLIGESSPDYIYFTVRGKIVEIIPNDDPYYVHVMFDNGEQYRIVLYQDFVLNYDSEYIFRLYYNKNSDYDFKYISNLIEIKPLT